MDDVRPGRAIATAIGPAAVGVLPSFLAGATAVQLRAELGIDVGALGLLFGAFFGGGALSSAALGRLAERWGPSRSLRVAAAGAGAVLVAIATVAHTFPTLVALLAVGGALNALAQPAANIWLARTIPPERHGLAFGVKQSAIPAAILLAGIGVPAIAIPFGWRWTFAVGAGLAAIVSLTVPSIPARAAGVGERTDRGELHTQALMVLAVGIGLGAGASGTLGSYLVSAAVDAGVGEGGAGLLYAAGAAVGLVVRLLLGRRADRVAGGHLRLVGALMMGGAAGYLLLATGDAGVIVVSTPLAFAIGWGWPGLYNLSIVRHHPGAAGAATGITQTGTYLGAVVGPVVFGAVVDGAGYSTAWMLAAAWSVAAGATTWWGRGLLRRSIAARAELAVT